MDKTLSKRRRWGLAVGASLATAALLTTFGISSASAVSVDSLAPTVRSVACGHNFSAVSVTPAAGFSPLTASDAQLTANGLPARPKTAAAFASWKKYVTGPISRPLTCPGFDSLKDRNPGGPVRSLSSASDVSSAANTSYNWAGNVANGGSWSQAEADWTVPAATGPDSSDSSQWVGVGLGQSSAAPLYQAGTDSRANVTPQVFIEVYPQEAEVIKFNVSPGDVLGVHVVVTSTGATFHVVDKTASIDRTYTWSGVSKVDGHAEWIDERPTAPTGNLYAYAKNTTTFTSAQAYSTSTGWTNVGNAPHYYYNMFSCNGATQLASTGAISGTNSYAVNWKAYGIIEKCWNDVVVNARTR